MNTHIKNTFLSVLIATSAFISMNATAGMYSEPVNTPIVSEKEQSPWMLRVRAIDVVPNAGSSTITGLGGEVTDISSTIVPELDINYFFTQHVSAELILATSSHDVTATGTSIGDVNLGSVNVLPPTLTLVYHFLPESTISPYVGAGLNYTAFYDVDSGPVANSIDYTNSFGPALQIGADIAIDKNWSINLDVKQLFIQTDATVNVGEDSYTTNVDVNPTVYGIGIGYRFT
jgi:outer membrane protein